MRMLADPRHSEQEARWHALGETNEGRVLHITFTLRDGNKALRVISARDMHRKEKAGVIPGAIQGALKATAISSGLAQSTGNTVGGLALVAKYKFATATAGLGISSILPEQTIDLGGAYDFLNPGAKSTQGGTGTSSSGPGK